MLHIKCFRNIRQVFFFFFFATTHIGAAQAYLCHVHNLLLLSVTCEFMKIVPGAVAPNFILKYIYIYIKIKEVANDKFGVSGLLLST